MTGAPAVFAYIFGGFVGAIRGICATWNWMISLARNLKGYGGVVVTGAEYGTPTIALKLESGHPRVTVTLEADGAWRIDFDPPEPPADDGPFPPEPDEPPAPWTDDDPPGGETDSCNEWSRDETLGASSSSWGSDDESQEAWAGDDADAVWPADSEDGYWWWSDSDSTDVWGADEAQGSLSPYDPGTPDGGNAWGVDNCDELNDYW